MRDLLNRLEEAKFRASLVKQEIPILVGMLRAAKEFADVDKARVVGAMGATLGRMGDLIGSFGPGFKKAQKRINMAITDLVEAGDDAGFVSPMPEEIEADAELKKLFESFQNEKYDRVITSALDEYLKGIIENANAAKAKVDEPMMVVLHLAEIVSKCVVIMAFMYQVTKKSAKLKAVTGRLDKLPGVMRAAARVKGFGPMK